MVLYSFDFKGWLVLFVDIFILKKKKPTEKNQCVIISFCSTTKEDKNNLHSG